MEKQRWEDPRREEKKEDQRRDRVRRKKMYVREKVETSRNTAFFQWFVAPDNGKVGLLKWRMRSHLGRWEMKNYTQLWREAQFEVKLLKTPHVQSTFGSWDVEKVHTVVARSTCHTILGALLEVELSCRKSARRCGRSTFLKLKWLKCTKHTMLGSLLEVEMMKKCTALWRNNFDVKNVKSDGFRALFEVEMLKTCTALWREAHFEAKINKTHYIRRTFWTFPTRQQQLQLQLQLPLH